MVVGQADVSNLLDYSVILRQLIDIMYAYSTRSRYCSGFEVGILNFGYRLIQY